MRRGAAARQRAKQSGSAVEPQYSIRALPDSITAGTLIGRGWEPRWVFEGEWSEARAADRWVLAISLRPVGTPFEDGGPVSCEVEGTVVWTMVDAGHPDRPRVTWGLVRELVVAERMELGASFTTGVELVRGWYDAPTRGFHVVGVDLIDPQAGGGERDLPPFLSPDEYRLTVSADGSRLRGTSRGNTDDWLNMLEGYSATAMATLVARQRLAWACGALQQRLGSASPASELCAELAEQVAEGGCPLLNAQALLPHGREGRVELAKRDWTQTDTTAEVRAEATGGA